MSLAAAKQPSLYGDLRSWALVAADCLKFMSQLPTASIDAVVTDPPYAIGMGHEEWDGGQITEPVGYQAFSADWAFEVKRVLKPGGHLLAFGSPRTFHRLVAGAEDVGLEIRDQLLWLHGRGVPKSRRLPGGISTTLKPAYEPILLARAPLATGLTAAVNIALYGTGGLNTEETRIARQAGSSYWPSQIVLSHEPQCGVVCSPGCAVAVIDDDVTSDPPSRLFYAGKAKRAEREAGLDALEHSTKEIFSSGHQLKRPRANVHPTVKPLDVMRWLVRLVAPPGGLVLDPFSGSGSTGCAAVLEGRKFFGIEQDKRYVPIARARLAHWTGHALEAGLGDDRGV